MPHLLFDMKTCRCCGATRDDKEFHSKGRGQRDTLCRGCRQERERAEYALSLSPDELNRLTQLREARGLSPAEKEKRRQRWSRELKAMRVRRLNDYKRAQPCKDCGQHLIPEAMDFDHLGDKSFDISKGNRKRSWPAVLSEIAKCDLVCANCHRVRTARRREGLPAVQPPEDYCI